MDRDLLLDELTENLDLVERASHKLEDINYNLPIEVSEYIRLTLVDAKASLKTAELLYRKEIRKLGGNY